MFCLTLIKFGTKYYLKDNANLWKVYIRCKNECHALIYNRESILHSELGFKIRPKRYILINNDNLMHSPYLYNRYIIYANLIRFKLKFYEC